MKRSLYRLLVRLHPQRFREQFGEEMISILDQSHPSESTTLIADAIVSLLRQHVVRSNLWKRAAGTAISALLICGWAYSMQQSMEASLIVEFEQAMKLQWAPPAVGTQLDRTEFQRETASAVAILGRIAKKQERERRAQPSAPHAQPSAPHAQPAMRAGETRTQG
jgi:hypothetical protein